MIKPLLTIEYSGQPYVSEPVMVEISKAKSLDVTLAKLFGRYIKPIIEEFSHYDHIQLKWMKPNSHATTAFV